MHLLLIEDDRALAQLVSEYLQQNGYQVTSAYNGRAGLQQALAHEYELVLLDIMLPEMDGFEVLRELRKQQKTPVLMLTAKGEDTDKIIGLELGADDYLAKPFNHLACEPFYAVAI
ncbi:response regulator [Idiomarina xiamenensis]|uniref:Transcriptional regulator n=1 Tax=Idiomarina xiamenensis 10-D-4 TaxID=740709 RepID=K2KV80_9GAMM|nr:transcriptional regulator [Idiomarina xiamenensis 10-D-4]